MKNRFYDVRRIKVFLGIGAAYLALWLLGDFFQERDTFFKRIWNNIWLISYLTFLNYILHEFTFPWIKLRWRRLLATPFILFAFVMLFSFGLYAWRAIGIGLNLYFSLREHENFYKGVEYHAPYGFLSIIFFGIIRHVYDYRVLKETTQRLRIEKQEAELNYLKSQTNPHFLFNTLNNIYALARDKSDLAPESILRLSKILRFMLYETNGNFIAVEQEIRIIDDYLALEKLRYDETLRVHFNYDIEDMKQSIPPLLLVPLVENAFKHGVSESRTDPFVDIHLSIKARVLTFVVKNSAESISDDIRIRESIGLSNLRRQLELLYGSYDLQIKPGDRIFTANLKINLATHV